jgi:thymidylate kinase
VRDGFRQLAASDPHRWVVIDAAGNLDQVAVAVAAAVRERLGLP